MIQKAISELVKGNDLSGEVMRGSMEEIMDGKASHAQTGAFLALLSAKGETVEEITLAAGVMRSLSEKVSMEGPLLDTCSTGGSGAPRFNISTAASFVLAGGGINVAKHGNRAVSGRCGSADLLSGMGVNIELGPAGVKECILRARIGFMFAPVFHCAMKNAALPRKELGIRSIFNILGPLTNPASATHQLLGVFSPELTGTLAAVLGNLGVERAMVVYGSGLDEVTLAGATRVSELKNGKVTDSEFYPSDFGLRSYRPDDFEGGGTRENVRIMRSVLEGEPGAFRDIVIANAAAGFLVFGRASGLKEGVELAEESIDAGRARESLEELIRVSRGSGK